MKKKPTFERFSTFEELKGIKKPNQALTDLFDREAAQLYADEFAKAFYDWISSEDGINTIHDLQLVGELPKGIPSFDQLKPHFKSSLKEKP